MKAPWQDFEGNDIYEGNVIAHPSGQKGVVVYHPERETPSDQWLIQYNDEWESRLCLQVSDKGRAVRL